MTRVRAVLTAALLGLVATAVSPVTPVDAAGSETSRTWNVPRQATIEIKGRGYGHGHGMSQYGAEGAAREGLDYRQIAEFYYPGTTWGRSTGRVTVLISGDTSDDLEVLARSGLTVRDLAGGAAVTLPTGPSRWRIAVVDGVNRVSSFSGTWKKFADLVGVGEFYADGEPITLVTPTAERAYRGRLRAVPVAAGSSARDTVNDVSMEDYLRGVVPLEIPALWSAAAVQAQAVAARTYASYERNHPRSPRYQLCDTTSCQVYGGVGAEHPAASRAVDATRKQVLLSDGLPAFTQFASSSGGWTSAGSVPYLPAIEDPYDDWAGNPVHTWRQRLDDDRFEQKWPAIGNLTSITVTDRDGNGQWGGRVRSITLAGDQGSVTITGDTFRSVLGLRSTWVSFKIS